MHACTLYLCSHHSCYDLQHFVLSVCTEISALLLTFGGLNPETMSAGAKENKQDGVGLKKIKRSSQRAHPQADWLT